MKDSEARGDLSLWTEGARPGVVVLESRPRLEAWIKRDPMLQTVPVRVVRKARELLDLPADWTRAVLVCDFVADPPGLLASLARFRCEGRDVRAVVVVPESELAWEWPLRELGAAQVLVDYAPRLPVLRAVRRQLGPLPERLEQTLAQFAPR